jgi:hypothetical protein
MTSLGTDFEMHDANWQVYVEEPTAKDLVAKKACTIALSEVQGTHWNRIKCKEHLGNCPEAVVRQATIKLDSQVWKSLEDSLPKLYCADLAEAYLMQESASSRNYERRKGMICDRPTDVCMRKLLQKAEQGKKTGTGSSTRLLRASCFMKMHYVCQKCGGAHIKVPWSPKGMRKWDKKLDSHAVEKGTKKLVSSNCVKILE